jgi:glyoxylase-like metal-dependent hydrolase (beta-lactamase superfamily II)
MIADEKSLHKSHKESNDMIEIIPVTACPGAECFLLLSESGAFLVDAGYAFCAERAVRNIARALGERSLDCILLTHSHYDHVGGLPTIKKAWPEAPVIAHPYVREVFARPGARRVMRSLDGEAAVKRGETPVLEDYTEHFTLDRTVGEGDTLRFGGASIRVMAMPGHTKCSVGYHFQEEDLFVLSETTGVRLWEGYVIPTFITGYKDSLRAIARVESLAPRRILISHSGPASGDDAMDYLRKARESARAAADLVLAGHARGKSPEEILADCTENFYVGSCRKYQPIEAFLLNTRAMIPRLIAEAEAESR